MTSGPWPYSDQTRARIQANLAGYPRRTATGDQLRPAAVSIVLIPNRDNAALLLTRRPPRMNAHAGQYALPGGKLDPGETAQDAALRELHEELGVQTAPAQVLGLLDDLPTRSGYLITPFVVWLGVEAKLRPSPSEIAEVHRIPLPDLFSGRGRGGNREEATDAEDEPGIFSLYLPTLGHDLFAPTAAVLDHFREVALAGRPTPVVRFGEPDFARR